MLRRSSSNSLAFSMAMAAWSARALNTRSELSSNEFACSESAVSVPNTRSLTIKGATTSERSPLPVSRKWASSCVSWAR